MKRFQLTSLEYLQGVQQLFVKGLFSPIPDTKI